MIDYPFNEFERIIGFLLGFDNPSGHPITFSIVMKHPDINDEIDTDARRDYTICAGSVNSIRVFPDENAILINDTMYYNIDSVFCASLEDGKPIATERCPVSEFADAIKYENIADVFLIYGIQHIGVNDWYYGEEKIHNFSDN